jgi:hypothetical protein
MIEIVSMILLYILVGSSMFMCYDAFIVDEEIEEIAKKRSFIQNIYNKVLGMSLKDIRGWLDKTSQYDGIIKLNNETDMVKISFEHYNFSFEHNSKSACIVLDNIKLYTGEDFSNLNNKYTIEHVYEILKYHHFDKLIDEEELRVQNGLFLGINNHIRWMED